MTPHLGLTMNYLRTMDDLALVTQTVLWRELLNIRRLSLVISMTDFPFHSFVSSLERVEVL